MNDILFNKIKKANSKYAEYLSACDKVAKAAQRLCLYAGGRSLHRD